MKAERIKNITLVLLIVSSLVLSFRIWFNEKIWPDGYDFVDSLKTTSIGKLYSSIFEKKDKIEAIQEDVLVPYNLFVYMVKNSDHAGYMLTANDGNFEEAKGFLHTTMGEVLSRADEKSFSQVSEEEWQNILCLNGIYADYGAAYIPTTFLQLVKATPNSDIISRNIEKMGRFAVVNDDGRLKVYISDLSNEKFYVVLSDEESEQLDLIVEKCSEQATVDNRFSFFIGADIETPIEGAAVFDSYIVLSESNVEAKTARNAGAEELAAEIFEKSESIAELFSINPKTARRYADSDEDVVFVQNQSSLKLSNGGYVEYYATTAGGGVKLDASSDDETALAMVLYPLVFLSENVNDMVSENNNISVYVSSTEENGGNYKVTLDYMFNGQPVVVMDDGKAVNAVSCEISGGYLTSYKQYITDFEAGKSSVLLPSSYSGIDLIFSDMSIDEKKETIKDMFIGYIDGDSGSVDPCWFVKIGNDSVIKY